MALVAAPYAEPDTYQAVESDLSEAGADITSVETLPAPDSTEVTEGELTTQETTTQLETGYTDIARKILGYTDEEVPAEIVIFVGGGRIPEVAPPGTLDALETAQMEMFEGWLDAGVRVIGAEPSDAGRTEIPLFQDAGIPSVDNADQPAGRAAIIQCASTDCEGTYGTKERASEPFPPPS